MSHNQLRDIPGVHISFINDRTYTRIYIYNKIGNCAFLPRNQFIIKKKNKLTVSESDPVRSLIISGIIIPSYVNFSLRMRDQVEN